MKNSVPFDRWLEEIDDCFTRKDTVYKELMKSKWSKQEAWERILFWLKEAYESGFSDGRYG